MTAIPTTMLAGAVSRVNPAQIGADGAQNHHGGGTGSHPAQSGAGRHNSDSLAPVRPNRVGRPRRVPGTLPRTTIYDEGEITWAQSRRYQHDGTFTWALCGGGISGRRALRRDARVWHGATRFAG